MINSHNARDRQVTRSLYAANIRDSRVRAAGSNSVTRSSSLFSPRPTLQWPEIEVEKEKERERERGATTLEIR